MVILLPIMSIAAALTTLVGMFYGAKNFNQPLTNWNISSVTDMNNIFLGAIRFNQPETLKHFGID